MILLSLVSLPLKKSRLLLVLWSLFFLALQPERQGISYPAPLCTSPLCPYLGPSGRRTESNSHGSWLYTLGTTATLKGEAGPLPGEFQILHIHIVADCYCQHRIAWCLWLGKTKERGDQRVDFYMIEYQNFPFPLLEPDLESFSWTFLCTLVLPSGIMDLNQWVLGGNINFNNSSLI